MPPLRFGSFELDPGTAELRRNGCAIHLAAQPLKVLTLLAARSGEVVTRDELRRHVWGDETFVDFDRSLNGCVAAVRAALNDDARSPRFIETVKHRGYRFLADVRTDAPAESRVAVAPAAKPRPGRRRRWAIAALPLLLAQAPLLPRATTRATAVPAAVAAYERGMREVAEGREGRRRAAHAFRKAIRLDPRFAEAYYQLADAYLELASARELPVAAALAEAAEAAFRAADLQPIAETKKLAGVLRLVRDWDWSGAQRDLAEARRLEPAWDLGLAAHGRLLSAKGDDEGALAAIDRAEALSPSCHLILMDSARIRYRARRYDEALVKIERAASFVPPDANERAWREEIALLRIRIRAGRGDWGSAQRDALSIIAANGYAEAVQKRFAATEPRLALRRFFERSVANMRPLAEAGRIAPRRMACLYALLREPQPVATWLERAAAERDPDLVFELRNPDYDAVQDEPRVAAVRERVFGASRTSRASSEPPLLATLMLP